jgi:hypothetical protein
MGGRPCSQCVGHGEHCSFTPRRRPCRQPKESRESLLRRLCRLEKMLTDRAETRPMHLPSSMQPTEEQNRANEAEGLPDHMILSKDLTGSLASDDAPDATDCGSPHGQPRTGESGPHQISLHLERHPQELSASPIGEEDTPLPWHRKSIGSPSTSTRDVSKKSHSCRNRHSPTREASSVIPDEVVSLIKILCYISNKLTVILQSHWEYNGRQSEIAERNFLC